MLIEQPNRKYWTYTSLKWLVWFNIFTTILHYVDNILFFAHYPEPTWLNPTLVDAFWFVMTPFALLALWLIKHQRLYWGLVSIPHCQNSCHPHPNNLNGGKGDNHGTIQSRTQTSNTKQTAIA